MSRILPAFALVAGCAAIGAAHPAAAESGAGALEHRLGRNEVRVFAAAHRLRVGDRLVGAALAARLDGEGYERVRRKPEKPGEYFWGHDRYWIFRRESIRPGHRAEPARLLEVGLDRASGRITRLRHDDNPNKELAEVALDPVLLSENLEGRRAPREWVAFETLPEQVWRAVLAIEDARFFDHGGVDPRSVARAVLRNAKAGRVTQGGSTITQQLIKIRDLTPRRTLGRKLSEALRAVALEAEHEKTEILEAYLNSVYFGHVDEVSIYGLGAAARAYFGKSAERLSVAESALLAGMIQGPNGLHPGRHPKRALTRQRAVLSRLEELQWLPAGEIAAARAQGLPRLARGSVRPAMHPSLLAWVRDEAAELAPKRAAAEQGVVVETTLDARLQALAVETVADGLRRLEQRYSRFDRAGVGVALVALDARSGDVLAAVGADPGSRSDLDRVRRARRQPGSTVKPFVALEALEACGARRPLYNSRRISDEPLTIELNSGPWSPDNSTSRFRGTVDLRTALVDSLNVPMVRVARWCGFEATAERFRAAGIQVPAEPPPSFVLGSLELTPIELAAAFTPFVAAGKRQEPRLIRRVRSPSGRSLGVRRARSRRVASAEAAYLVRDVLREAGAGVLGAASFEGQEIMGKTGTSSDRRDAWFAGSVGSMVVVVWIGRDDGSRLGLTGAQAAAPIWKAFGESAARELGSFRVPRPRAIVERYTDPDTGLITRSARGDSKREVFRKGNEPGRKRLLFGSTPEPPIR